jgi:hypothetical protein
VDPPLHRLPERARAERGGGGGTVNWIFLLGALLVTAGWLGYRRRLSEIRPRLTDADIRAIEEGGRVGTEEPLDFDEAAEEEERFWGESWDEPEPM